LLRDLGRGRERHRPGRGRVALGARVVALLCRQLVLAGEGVGSGRAAGADDVAAGRRTDAAAGAAVLVVAVLLSVRVSVGWIWMLGVVGRSVGVSGGRSRRR